MGATPLLGCARLEALPAPLLNPLTFAALAARWPTTVVGGCSAVPPLAHTRGVLVPVCMGLGATHYAS